MGSGSYFPPPVRRGEIPQDKGGVRALGMPTVSERRAQRVVKREREPIGERSFPPDSEGYRPGKSAMEAGGGARQRCGRDAWALPLDVIGCFDNLARTLLRRAVRTPPACPRVGLDLERWLAAPVPLPEGSLMQPEKGVPQGAVLRPVRRTLFLPYAFAGGMPRAQAGISLARYAADGLCHGTNRGPAERLKVALTPRWADWG
jgi:RNA-directed DNA polymerase